MLRSARPPSKRNVAKVRRISAAYPEQGERRRYWTTPEQAARLVAEPGLKAIFRAM